MLNIFIALRQLGSDPAARLVRIQRKLQRVTIQDQHYTLAAALS